MDDDDWAHTLAVFCACLPRCGRKLRTIATSSRRCISSLSRTFAGALCRSASVIGTACGGFDRLSKAGVFEAFFEMLASMSSTAHLIQMFDSTIVRAHVSAAEENGEAGSARPLARRLHHENPRKIGRLRRHHRLRSDRREASDGRHFETLFDIGPAFALALSSATKATPARPIGTPRERAASLLSFPTRPTKRTSRLLRTHPLQGPRPHRAGRRTPQALQTRRAPLRKDSQELQVYRRLRRRPLLDQIRPHGLGENPRCLKGADGGQVSGK